MAYTKNRRKLFLVDKSLQLHYLSYIILTLLAVSAIGLIGSYQGISSAFQESLILSPDQKAAIQQIMDETHKKIWILIFLLLIVISWGSIFLMHKVAGPIFKLGKLFGELASGDLTVRIRLRKYDECEKLADQFNEMSATLDASIARIKQIAHKTPALPDELKKELQKFKTTIE